ncbi:hypothetical protein HDU82_005725 [Entophlyctis luteolus]|nr:hypothetical protein HDU82_005725 [Entophlyctis luteolus]
MSTATATSTVLAVGSTYSAPRVSYFGTNTTSDPSPVGGNNKCGSAVTNQNYFAALSPSLFSSKACGDCIEVSCSTCVEAVTVQIVDECSSCTSDIGDISISLQAMGDLLGGVSIAEKAGIVSDASWTVVLCTSAFGVVQTGGGSSNVSTATTTTPVASSTSSGDSGSNLGAILGGVAAGIFLLFIVGFAIYLKRRQRQEVQEERNMSILRHFGGSRNYTR